MRPAVTEHESEQVILPEIDRERQIAAFTLFRHGRSIVTIAAALDVDQQTADAWLDAADCRLMSWLASPRTTAPERCLTPKHAHDRSLIGCMHPDRPRYARGACAACYRRHLSRDQRIAKLECELAELRAMPAA